MNNSRYGIGVIAIIMLCGTSCARRHKIIEVEKEIMRNEEAQGNKKGGIVFLNTNDLEGMKDYYLEKVGCTLWLDQGSCLIFQHGNQLLGFCQAQTVQKVGTITFFYTDKSAVDRMYEKFKDVAAAAPKMNPKYKIYHFYAKDPEGRSLEFQYFDHPLPDF